MAGSELSAKAQATLGLPEGFKTYSPFPFTGMNLQDSAVAIEDTEFTWMENFIRTGKGSLRTAWDVGAPIYTVPVNVSIVYFAFYTIGVQSFCAVFLSTGVAIQIDTVTLEQIPIGTGFYTSSGQLPYARQWGTQYLLVCNRNTPNDYWIWDGRLLYFSGTAAPNGVNILSGGFNYSSDPIITAYGGLGSGMTFTSKQSGGAIVQVQIENPGTGYEVGDVVQLSFSGGGSDTSAVLTANLENSGVGGATITAPGSGYTTATAVITGGGGTGATATVQISTGVTSVTISKAGSGYTFANVSFAGGGGTGATAIATVSDGIISNITVTNPGAGYTSSPAVVVTGDGTGAQAAASISGGVISGISITAPGTGYTSAPFITISGDGTGATAVSILQPSGVASVNVLDGGTGFVTVPLITFTGGGGAGATGVARLTGTSIDKINLTAGGSGYTSAPAITFIGGDGTGAAATAVLVGDAVGSVTIDDPGTGYTSPIEVQFTGGGGTGAGATVLYVPTSIDSVVISSTGQNYTSAPAVEVTPGANNSAYATVDLMPYGVSGSAMETFLSRVWIINPAQDPFSSTPPGGNFQFSAPGSVIDFATSDGGGQATNTDSFLQTQYTNIRQSSGYLYFFGDGSVSVISNVATSGTPTVTTYNYQNVDPQAGLAWRDALQDFGRSTIIMNQTGVFGLYGGAATKISGKINDLFVDAVFPPFEGAVTPSSAVAVLFDNKHYLSLATIRDPDLGAARNVMLSWNEKEWYITSQSTDLTFIGTQKLGSNYTAWGTDGTKLVPLFETPSKSLVKRLDTKQYGTDRLFIQKELIGTWMTATDKSQDLSGIDGQFTIVTSGLAYQNQNFPSVQNAVLPPLINERPLWSTQPVFKSPAPFNALWGGTPFSISFVTAALRFQSQSPDFILSNWVLGYKDVTAFF